MKNLLLPFILILGISIQLNAQEKTKHELRGDKYAFRYAYDKAINSYKKADPLTLDGQRKLADSYYKLNQNPEAEEIYATIISSGQSLSPEDYFTYAMILKSNGKYDESNQQMDKFQQMKPDDLRAKSYMNHKADLSKMMTDDGKYKTVRLDMNSDAQEFGTAYYKDQIVFTSSDSRPRFIKRTYNATGKPFLDLCSAEIDGIQLKKIKSFDKKLNGKWHDGPASFSNNGTVVAFTRNHYKDKSEDKVVELQIFLSTSVDGKWSEPEAFQYNNNAYSVGHPFLTADGKTMYFASDMPGGFGGTDIYKTEKNAQGWSKPVNLGNKINTEGHELFPFFEENKQILIIASDGHFGLGGLDLFLCPLTGSEWGNIVNAGSPLNTRYNDFAAISDGMMDKGYFSSDRNGDDDIYALDFLKNVDLHKTLEGIAKDGEGKAIPMTRIYLSVDKSTLIDSLTTSNDGAYSFPVNTDMWYNLTGKKESYIDGYNAVSTFGEEEIVKADVILFKEVVAEVIPIAEIPVNSDLGKAIKLKNIYFDYDQFAIRPDAAIELDKIVAIMNENPTLEVELGAHSDCRGAMVYNDWLSQQRANSSTNYIKERLNKNKERIHGKGYGETKVSNGCTCENEAVSTCTTDEHQENRRTEFIVVKK
ncbi:MAG: hypothetical protein K0R65_2952 [Crocinitomicaceae bacterium]|jgi:outer membrane protein OmpA-like peptidoglycan-associated protein|nr:hypothetical protein [Crocinitomicaceae bacterium]